MTLAKRNERFLGPITGEKVMSGLSAILGGILLFLSINLLSVFLTDLLVFLAGLGTLGMGILCFYATIRALKVNPNAWLVLGLLQPYIFTIGFFMLFATTQHLLGFLLIILVAASIFTLYQTKGKFETTMTIEAKDARLAYALIVPTFSIVGIIIFFPLIYNQIISFQNVNLKNLAAGAPFIGLSNYRYVLRDPEFIRVVVRTVVYAISSTVLAVIIGLVAALLMNRKFKGRGIARALFLFPYIAPVVALTLVWTWLLHPVYGVSNWSLRIIGREPPAQGAWLSVYPWNFIILILFESWRYFPFAMLMILAQLQAINPELYEAADVDGASNYLKFRFITLLELRYVIAVVFLLRLMWNFNKFDDIFLLTGDIPETTTLPILVYRYSFGTIRLTLGLAAATAMFIFIILVVFLVTYTRTVLKW
ncbi:MAG: carbohydrate ABC transporter permease [Candidatus Heimdallarchaeota archaeon]